MGLSYASEQPDPGVPRISNECSLLDCLEDIRIEGKSSEYEKGEELLVCLKFERLSGNYYASGSSGYS